MALVGYRPSVTGGRESDLRVVHGREQVHQEAVVGAQVLALVVLRVADHHDRQIRALDDGRIGVGVDHLGVGERGPEPVERRDHVGGEHVARSTVAQVRDRRPTGRGPRPSERVGASGQQAPSLRSSTIEAAAASRASARCSGAARTSSPVGSANT